MRIVVEFDFVDEGKVVARRDEVLDRLEDICDDIGADGFMWRQEEDLDD